MSDLADMTIDALKARRAALRAAELSLLSGERVTKVSYDGGSVEYAQGADVEQIRRAIFETTTFINIKSGKRSGGGIVPTFCG